MAEADEAHTESEPTLVEQSIADAPVANVTVYKDRAEVNRIVTVPISASGLVELRLTGLVENANPDSLRVRTDFGRCSILEVSTAVHRHDVDLDRAAGGSGPEAEARAILEKKREALSVHESEVERIIQRDTLIQGYMEKMLTPKGIANPLLTSVGAATPTFTLSTEKVSELLEFHTTIAKQTDNELRAARKCVSQCEREVLAAEKVWRDLKTSHDLSRTEASRDVSILLNVAERKAGEKDAVAVQIIYNVSNASWSPTYDIRVDSTGDSSPDNKKSPLLQLSYFGEIKQNSGEDWNNCKVSLSTATPSAGGSPPVPPTRIVRYKQHQPYSRRAHRVVEMQCMPQAAMASAIPGAVPAQAAMRSGEDNVTETLNPDGSRTIITEVTNSDGTKTFTTSVIHPEEITREEELSGRRGREGIAPATTVTSATGGSFTFQIERRATIASDAKLHKVCISVLELDPQLRHFATPALSSDAYLQAQVANTSAYPLLASKKASVFLGGSFICMTAIKMISPGESFSVFLGADVAIKVKHKLVKKVTSEGTQGSKFRKTQNSRQVFEYITALYNTKEKEPVNITVVELLPRSEDDKIVVNVLNPPPQAFGENKEEKGSDALSWGEGQLKTGSVMKNKITNNIVFAKKLAPQEKLEIPFSYSIEWPPYKETEIV